MIPQRRSSLASELDGFEQRLRRLGADGVSKWRPPAGAEELVAVERATGYALPDEARDWWSWHNGADDWWLFGGALGASAFRAIPIDQALRFWRERVSVVRATEAELADDPGVTPEVHENSWFPIARARHGGELLLELAVRANEPSPVRIWEWEDPESWQTRMPSLSDVVRFWNDLIDRDIWQWGRETGWTTDYEKLTPDERRSGLG